MKSCIGKPASRRGLTPSFVNWSRLARNTVVSVGLAVHALSHVQAAGEPGWVTLPQPQDALLQNLSIPADAPTRGMWSGVFPWPMNGLHSAVLPDGKVLTFGTNPDGGAQNGRWYDIWDPLQGTGTVSHQTNYDPNRQDSFCAAATYLDNGEMLIAGGNGAVTTTLFDPSSNTSRTDVAQMADDRWYPTLITLPDGRPIIMGGMTPYTEGMVDNPDQAIANGWPSMTPEVYENGGWRSLFGAYSRDAFGPDFLRTSYPRAWVAPNGQVFGISADKTWYLAPDANNGQGAITYVGAFKQPYSRATPVNVGAVGTAVMYAPGRILQVGGNGGHNGDGLPASDQATVVDINNGLPQLFEQAPMRHARRYPNSVVLANGHVVVTGGTTYGNSYAGEPATPIYAAELWNPETGQWTEGASAGTIRVYHSITALLPNGTVLSTGGGTPGPVTNLNGEIYYPPYLFQTVNGAARLAPRPVVVAINALKFDHGASLQLDMATDEPVSALVLIATSSGTHSFNSGQRRIPLNFGQDGVRVSASVPADTLAPPGYYQVVVINADGVPSHGAIVSIGDRPAPDIGTVNPPADNGSLADISASATLATSHVSPWESLQAVTDGTLPANSADKAGGAYGNWDGEANYGQTHWVSLSWDSARTLAAFEVYWWNDGMGIATPSAAQVDYFDGANWVPVGPIGRDLGQFNRIEFPPVTTAAIRVSMSSARATGILEARAYQLNTPPPDDPPVSPPGDLSASARLSTSHVSSWESLGAVVDGSQPENSADKTGGAYGNWDGEASYGQTHWVSLSWDSARTLSAFEVYWWNDGMGIATPTAAQVEYFDGAGWVAIGPIDRALNRFNRLDFTPVTTTAIRVAMSSTRATGILELRVFGTSVVDDPEPPEPPVLPLIEAPVIRVGLTATYSPRVNFTGGRFQWQFGDGSPASPVAETPQVTHTFPRAGVYPVRLIATLADGQVLERAFLQAVANPVSGPVATASSLMALEAPASGPERLWIANPDNDTVAVMNSATQAIVEIGVGAGPRSVARAPDGRIWVSNKADASISIVDANSLSVVDTIALPRGSQPHGLVFAPDGLWAMVALEARGQLLKLDPDTGGVIAVLDVAPTPRHLSVSGDSRTVLTSRFITPPLPGESTVNVDLGSGGGEVLVVDAASMQWVDVIRLPPSLVADTEASGGGVPNYLGGAVISPDSTSAWVPSKQDNVGRGMRRNGLDLNFQNTVRAISSRINMATFSEDVARRIDHDNASVATAAAYDPSGAYLFVALETSREVAVVDAISGVELFRVDTDLAPQAVSVSDDGLRLYVKNFMARNVSVFDLSRLMAYGLPEAPVSATVPTVGVERLPPQILLGKQLFYDARDPRLALDRYMSCATCHNDGGHDGRVWDFSGSGEGLRNTIALNGRGGMAHGLLHWSANFDEVQDFEGQIRRLAGGTGLMTQSAFDTGSRSEPLGDPKAGVSADLDALAAYVTSLTQFDTSPTRDVDGQLTRAGLAGRRVFEAQGCAECHGGPALTGSATGDAPADVGTLTVGSGNRLGGALTGIDVPTLRDVWSTAPYLHDGSALTLRDAVLAHVGTAIADDDLSNLVAYLDQIDGSEPGPVTSGPAEELAASASLATSHVSPWETLEAVNNGIDPANSADKNGGAYGNWNGEANYGQTEWVSLSWSGEKTLSAFEVYWWNDGLGIATPTSATVEYFDGTAWVPIGPIGRALNTYNRIEFSPVTTTSIRVSMASARATGILEIRAWGY